MVISTHLQTPMHRCMGAAGGLAFGVRQLHVLSRSLPSQYVRAAARQVLAGEVFQARLQVRTPVACRRWMIHGSINAHVHASYDDGCALRIRPRCNAQRCLASHRGGPRWRQVRARVAGLACIGWPQASTRPAARALALPCRQPRN